MARKRERRISTAEEEEAEFWTWYMAASKEEQLAVIKQTLEENPEEFLKLPNGNWTIWPKTPSC